MPARTGTAPLRNIDFSAVGKAGRRTGITLPQQRLDEHGLEEVSHLFSSPKKPSPLKQSFSADPDEDEANATTPRPTDQARRTPHASIPRSVSPRKSGISGTAKRASGFAIRSAKKNGDTGQPQLPSSPNGQENTPRTPSTNATKRSYRHAPSSSVKAPLRDITQNLTPASVFRSHKDDSDYDRDIVQSVEDVHPQDYELPRQHATPARQSLSAINNTEEEGLIHDGDDTGVTASEEAERTYSEGSPAPTHARRSIEDDPGEEEAEEENQQPTTVNLPGSTKPRPHTARKRRSGLEIPDSSPAPKRSRTEPVRLSKTKNVASIKETSAPAPEPTKSVQPAQPAQPQAKSRQPLKKKDTNTMISKSQGKELDQVIERIRSRPNPPKSLYILRRETPEDDTVRRTRSGRVSFKPLAYWRNERCVWGSSPSNTGIKDGARFPLNSIKEIIRTEEEECALSQKKKSSKGKKTKTKSRLQPKAKDGVEDQADDQCSDYSELDDDIMADPHAEEWEVEQGTLYGNVAIWDPDLQQPTQAEEEIEIAIAGAAIEKTGIKHPSQAEDAEPEFKYAKLLGNKFMGAGLVDLQPGGIKRPKNSKKMHMTFYVVKGRVTVTVGPSGAEPNRFSIGKGGFWQVPRGNQYSIENDLDKPARIFFSQGCEVEVGLDE